jgi:hypothetical protein
MGMHTKLPWSLVEARTRHGHLCEVHAGDGYDVATVYGRDPDEREANAAFIVKAVNAHETLISALRAVEQDAVYIENGENAISDKVRDMVRTALESVRETA